MENLFIDPNNPKNILNKRLKLYKIEQLHQVKKASLFHIKNVVTKNLVAWAKWRRKGGYTQFIRSFNRQLHLLIPLRLLSMVLKLYKISIPKISDGT